MCECVVDVRLCLINNVQKYMCNDKKLPFCSVISLNVVRNFRQWMNIYCTLINSITIFLLVWNKKKQFLRHNIQYTLLYHTFSVKKNLQSFYNIVNDAFG